MACGFQRYFLAEFVLFRHYWLCYAWEFFVVTFVGYLLLVCLNYAYLFRCYTNYYLVVDWL